MPVMKMEIHPVCANKAQPEGVRESGIIMPVIVNMGLRTRVLTQR